MMTKVMITATIAFSIDSWNRFTRLSTSEVVRGLGDV